MGLTPNHGLPYAEGHEFLTDYPELVDEPRAALLDGLLSNPGGIIWDAGNIYHVSVDGYNGQQVFYAPDRFTSAPLVFLTWALAPEYGTPQIGFTNRAADSFILQCFHTAAGVSISVDWFAIQLPDAAAMAEMAALRAQAAQRRPPAAPPITITINAGAGADPHAIAREIRKALPPPRRRWRDLSTEEESP